MDAPWTLLLHFSPCKGIRMPESGKFFMWNQESGRILLVESGILAATLKSGIQLKEFGVLLKNGIQNPSSINKD